MPKSNPHDGSNSCKEDLNRSNKSCEKSKESRRKCLEESSTRALEDSSEILTKALRSKCVEEASTRALEDSNETRSKISEEAVENSIELNVFLSSQQSSEEEVVTKLLETLERSNAILGEKMVDDHIDSDGECKLISLKRKRSTVDFDFNASVRNESVNTCSSPAGAVQSLSSPCRQSDKVETCGKCLKRQRY